MTGNPRTSLRGGRPSLTAALWGVDTLSSLLPLALCLSMLCYVFFLEVCSVVIRHMAGGFGRKKWYMINTDVGAQRGNVLLNMLLKNMIWMCEGDEGQRQDRREA